MPTRAAHAGIKSEMNPYRFAKGQCENDWHRPGFMRAHEVDDLLAEGFERHCGWPNGLKRPVSYASITELIEQSAQAWQDLFRYP